MKLILTLCVINLAWCLGSSQSYFYEKMNNYGLGKRIIQNYRRLYNPKEHPEPLPTTADPKPYVRSPYNNIYQGVRRKGDKRVYNNRFDYAENPSGQQLICRGEFPCVINHVAAETEGAIPTLLRGGTGYRHFVVLVRAPPGRPLRGRVRVFCYNYTQLDDDLPPLAQIY